MICFLVRAGVYYPSGDEQPMKEITSYTSNFEDIIKGNYLYVDKTEYIWNLVKSYKGVYFMARPRRFGKSLTVSTLEAVFQGRRDLFKGLAIDAKSYTWDKHPVIHLDMGNFEANTADELDKYIFDKLSMIASKFGLELQGASNATRFEKLVSDLYKVNSVVILLDEYDKPLLNNAKNPHISDILTVLKSFYSTIKTCDEMERFVFITGVSKFSHVSLFSGLNNPTDISMRPEYATMLGYTQNELETNFAEYIEIAAQKLNTPRDEFLTELKEWYDGFCFEADSETVYNPFSIAKFFESATPVFDNYWFDTATPSFLIDYCKSNQLDIENALTNPVSKAEFSAYDIDNISPLALMFQTGYLTIKDSFTRNRRIYYHMRFPNEEVTWAFEVNLLNAYTGLHTSVISSLASSLVDSIATGNADEVMALIKSFFAKIPYPIQIEDEKYYQSLFYAIFILLNVDIEAEACTNDGRIDATSATGDWRFIFEFKLNKTAEIALDQIEKKVYFQKYRDSGKRIMLVGANFSFEKRQITDWIAKEYIP